MQWDMVGQDSPPAPAPQGALGVPQGGSGAGSAACLQRALSITSAGQGKATASTLEMHPLPSCCIKAELKCFPSL